MSCFQSSVKCVLILMVAVGLIQEAASANLCRGYNCRDGTCVGGNPLIIRCNEDTQCPDRSDEFRCESCDDGFPCDNGECTSSIFDRCDSVRDCSDGSDEDNCGVNLIGVIVGSVVGGVVLFICCPIAIIVTIICCVFCCVAGQSNRQHNSIKRSSADDTAAQKVPLTIAPDTHEVPVSADEPQSYPLQPTEASAPPLDTPAEPADQQGPPRSAPYPTNPPPPYPGTIGTLPIETINQKEPLQ